MRIFNSFEEAKGKIRKAVVTIGCFDGIHLGHKKIIKRLNDISEKIGGESTLITFEPHPRKVLYPENNDISLILSKNEKIEFLKKCKLKNIVLVPFTKSFSKTSSLDFVKTHLLGCIDTKALIIGNNYQFGYKKEGDNKYLQELTKIYDFKVIEMPLENIGEKTVSSTQIRKAIKSGNIESANNYLGYNFFISGDIEESEKLPDINNFKVHKIKINDPDKIVPPPGIYAVKTTIKSFHTKAMAVLYKNPDNDTKTCIKLISDEFIGNKIYCSTYFYKRITDKDILNNNTDIIKELSEAGKIISDMPY